MRYDTCDENGETRRERNTRFGVESPDADVPEVGDHVWDWFWELSGRRKPGPEPISYAEIGEWQRLTGTQVLPEEVRMLIAMDDAYLGEFGKERQAYYERMKDKSKARK